MGTGRRVLDLILTGNASGAQKALRDTDDAAGKFSSATSTALLAAGAAVLGFGIKSANTFEKVGTEVLRVQRYMGSTPEEASKLRFAAQQTGIDVDKLTTGLARFSKTLAASPELMQQFGTYANDANGKLRPMSELLPIISDKFASMPNGIEKNALAMQLFGRSGADLIPLLNKGSAGLEELSAKAERMGVVLDGDALQAVKENKLAHRDWNAALEGLQISIGQHVLPVLTNLTEGASKLLPYVKDLIQPPALVAGGMLVLAGAGMKAYAAIDAMRSGAKAAPAALKLLQEASAATGLSTGALAGYIGLAVVAMAALAYQTKLYNDHVDKLRAGWDPNVQAAKVDALAGGYEHLTAKTAEYADMAAHAVREGNGLSAEMKAGTQAVDDVSGALSGYVEQVDALASSAGISKEQATEWLSRQQSLNIEFDSAAAAVGAYTGKIDTSTMSAQEAADAMKAQRDAIRAVNDEYRAATDPLFAVYKAQRDVESAQQAVNDALKEHVAGSPEVNDAQLKLMEATLNSSAAQRTLAGEINNNTAGAPAYQAALQEMVDGGLDPSSAAALGLNGQLYDLYLKSYAKYGSPNVNVTSNVDDLIRKFGTLADLYDRLNKPLPLYLNPNAPAYGSGLGVLQENGSVRSFADGGWNGAHLVRAGSNVVRYGEMPTGGEAYIPLSPAKRTRSAALLADVAHRFGMDLGGGTPIVIDVGGVVLQSVSPDYDADALLEKIDARLRERGLAPIGSG